MSPTKKVSAAENVPWPPVWSYWPTSANVGARFHQAASTPCLAACMPIASSISSVRLPTASSSASGSDTATPGSSPPTGSATGEMGTRGSKPIWTARFALAVARPASARICCCSASASLTSTCRSSLRAIMPWPKNACACSRCARSWATADWAMVTYSSVWSTA